jgi:nicotinate phosphoribosyltransferase
MRGGDLLPGSEPPISEIWELAQQHLARLPDRYKALADAAPYPVRFSQALQELRQRTGAQYAGGAKIEE